MLLSATVLAERRLPPHEFERHHRAKYGRPVRKAMNFIVTEGPRATLRKARSKLVERRIEADQLIVIALVEIGRRRFVGVTRDIGGALRFHPALLFERAGAELAGSDLEAIELTPHARTLLESWLPVPSCPLSPALPAALLDGNPWLRSAERDAGSADDGGADKGGAAAGGADVSRSPHAPGLPSRRSLDREVYLLGYGGYVREQVLPHFTKEVAAAVDFKAELIMRHAGDAVPVSESLGHIAGDVAGSDRPLVIISTYHSDHVAMAKAVLEINATARVFVEKPPAVSAEEARVLESMRQRGAWIDIGYNRRHAPFTRELAALLQEVPKPWQLLAEVKELKLPPSHWYFWPNQGTRITGNACHWLDLFCHLTPADVAEMTVLGEDSSVSLALQFDDGTVGTIVATDRGDDTAGVTERIQARGGDSTITIDEFRTLTHASGRGRNRTRRLRRDKGHAAMYRDLRRRWLADEPPSYPTGDIVRVAEVVERAAQAVQRGDRVVRFDGRNEPGEIRRSE